ncbi:alpha/beta-hydrolase [Peniophora sp. CONT]|nr:alpha/beta-hydrolase [Peniophora sp. CONT]
MVHRAVLQLLALVQASLVAALAVGRDEPQGPIIVLDNGTFLGTSEGAVSVYRGIPFAQPPVGDLRFRLPVANDPYTGTYNATAFGASCILQPANNTDVPNLSPIAVSIFDGLYTSSVIPGLGDDEDCLTINVYAPANVTQDSKLPVVYWIYGGGFLTGASSGYNGSAIVERSLQLDQPVVYVSVNYRLSALGFAGSAEVREAGIGNLGLQDQRQGLRWVQQYVSAFGGDPSKVTIWGESAGSISVAMQLLANNGDNEGLFRAGFMQSGGPISQKTGQVEDGQTFFDEFASDAGCIGSVGSIAVFDCLRNASLADIRSAIAKSRTLFDYASLSLAWQPRADGAFLTDNAQRLVLNGSVADVPFVIGNDDDEGTLFSLANSNITTEDELREYLQQYYFPTANASTLDSILAAYPEDPTLGSPFDTGANNSITPEYKRIAAMLGDYVLQAPRRFLLTERPGNASAYSFLYKRGKDTPYLGAAHGTDLNIFQPGDLMDALINFATNLNPNGPTLIDWPSYTAENPALFTFIDGNATTQVITEDTYRLEVMQVLQQVTLAAAT